MKNFSNMNIKSVTIFESVLFELQYAILCSWVVVGSANAAPLYSPCPNVFQYEGEPEYDRWYGIMTFTSNIELVGLIYKIQLDRPGQLLVVSTYHFLEDKYILADLFIFYLFRSRGMATYIAKII